MLRQGSASGLDGGRDLHVRMHFLSRMRERHPEGPLPELRWRARRASAPTGSTAGQVSTVDAAGVEARWVRGQSLEEQIRQDCRIGQDGQDEVREQDCPNEAL